jgi:ABC-2 type transport system permease protein
MPIFDQGYQHWEGKLSGLPWRWLTIALHGVRVQFKSRWARAILIVSLGPALCLAGFMIAWSLVIKEANRGLIESMGFLPDAIKQAPQNFRLSIWTRAFEWFFQAQLWIFMVLVLFVGPNLISGDLRFNSLPLYFSRPLRRLDYFIGKLGVIGFFLAAVAIVPVVLAFLLSLCFTLDTAVMADTARLLLGSIVYGLVVTLSAGTLMLAISALSRNSRYVQLIWVGVWIVPLLCSVALIGGIRAEWCPAVSYATDLHRICQVLLKDDEARDKIDEAMRQMRGGMAAADLGPFAAAAQQRAAEAERTRVEARMRGRQPSQQPQPDQDLQPLPEFARPREPTFKPPLRLAVLVLASLFGISLWILTSRVKSLDRLR